LRLLVVFVPKTSSTPVTTWFWQTEGRSAERVILEFDRASSSRWNFNLLREEFLSALVHSPYLVAKSVLQRRALTTPRAGPQPPPRAALVAARSCRTHPLRRTGFTAERMASISGLEIRSTCRLPIICLAGRQTSSRAEAEDDARKSAGTHAPPPPVAAPPLPSDLLPRGRCRASVVYEGGRRTRKK
jgi:hypothetical protein